MPRMNRGNFPRWTAPRSYELLWEYWDGEHILYTPLSGETHLLNDMAARAVGLLGEQPLAARELAEQLGNAFDVVVDSEFMEIVESTLAQLDQLGLIVPLEP